jgi:hypothetical protein
MCFAFSLIPATIWVVLGYFVLYSSTKTQGTEQRFGHFLAIWVFVVAAFFPVMGAYVTLTGLCPSIETMIKLKFLPPSKRTGLLDGLSADQRHTSALPPAIFGLL